MGWGEFGSRCKDVKISQRGKRLKEHRKYILMSEQKITLTMGLRTCITEKKRREWRIKEDKNKRGKVNDDDDDSTHDDDDSTVDDNDYYSNDDDDDNDDYDDVDYDDDDGDRNDRNYKFLLMIVWYAICFEKTRNCNFRSFNRDRNIMNASRFLNALFLKSNEKLSRFKIAMNKRNKENGYFKTSVILMFWLYSLS